MNITTEIDGDIWSFEVTKWASDWYLVDARSGSKVISFNMSETPTEETVAESISLISQWSPEVTVGQVNGKNIYYMGA